MRFFLQRASSNNKWHHRPVYVCFPYLTGRNSVSSSRMILNSLLRQHVSLLQWQAPSTWRTEAKGHFILSHRASATALSASLPCLIISFKFLSKCAVHVRCHQQVGLLKTLMAHSRVNTHSAANTSHHIVCILVCETVQRKCQQVILLSTQPSKMRWPEWRKPDVWARSARYPSQRHSSASRHRWTPHTPFLLIQQYVQNIACHTQTGMSQQSLSRACR